MNYKAVFLDIDGTILKSDHTYAESTANAIAQLNGKGVEVFIATGRPLHEVDDLAESLHVESFIGYNGSYATYQQETIVEEPMDTVLVRKFLDIAKEHGHEMVLYTKEKNYFTSLGHPFVQRFNEIFQLKKNAQFTEDVIDEVISATILNVPASDAPLYEQLGDDLHLSAVNVNGVEQSFDIIRKSVNKGEAVKKVLERLDIPKEQAIAFGDGMNDKEMLQAVGEGFAMENAHPDLFAYAKRKTATVEKDGIYEGLKELGLLE